MAYLLMDRLLFQRILQDNSCQADDLRMIGVVIDLAKH